MVKKTITLIIIILMLISCISVTAYAENADASYSDPVITLRAGGGGGSGGGSGGGGGGSSSSSHHSSTSRQPTLFESILQFILTPFFLFSSSIIFYVKLTKRSRKSKKLMKQMVRSDNAWKYKEISATVNNAFFAIQTAWSNMDMASATEYMSVELYDSFQTKLNWMAFRNQKNVLEHVSLLQALPVAVYDDLDNTRDYVWFFIKGRMVDYIIDTNTQLKISGNTSAASFIEYWQFVRKDDSWVLNKILQKNESNQIPFSE